MRERLGGLTKLLDSPELTVIKGFFTCADIDLKKDIITEITPRGCATNKGAPVHEERNLQSTSLLGDTSLFRDNSLIDATQFVDEKKNLALKKLQEAKMDEEVALVQEFFTCSGLDYENDVKRELGQATTFLPSTEKREAPQLDVSQSVGDKKNFVVKKLQEAEVDEEVALVQEFFTCEGLDYENDVRRELEQAAKLLPFAEQRESSETDRAASPVLSVQGEPVEESTVSGATTTPFIRVMRFASTSTSETGKSKRRGRDSTRTKNKKKNLEQRVKGRIHRVEVSKERHHEVMIVTVRKDSKNNSVVLGMSEDDDHSTSASYR